MPLGIDVDAMRRSWLQSADPSLERRRIVAGLAAFGAADFAFLSLYQLGLLQRLPDLRLPFFDAERVNASRKAYLLGAPDAPIAAALHGLMLTATAWGGTRETGRPRAADWLLALLAGAGAIAALDYMRSMVFEQRRVCLYCVAAAAASMAIFPLALRELWQRR